MRALATWWPSYNRCQRSGVLEEVEKDQEEMLALYVPLRACGVRDRMNWNIRPHYGSVSQTMRSVYRTRVVGSARTARYVPYEGALSTMTGEEYAA